MSNPDCIFCKIASGKVSAEKIYENANFFSILDANPVVEGHSLVISKKHFENSLELPSSLGVELLDAIKNTVMKILEKYKVDGFNILNNNSKVAGQIINHVHFHIIPRKEGDGLKILG